jgi:hypothetical protein
MAENLYYMGNHTLPSTGLPTKVTTGTAAVVMLQLSVPSTRQFNLVEWGIDFDGSPAAIQVQVRATSAAATATNMTAGIITPFSNPGMPTSLSTSGTSNSCFFNGTSTAAPTSTVTAVYDTRILSTNTYDKFWPLSREPVAAVSTFIQVCVLASAAVNASCYIIWRE